MQVKWLALALHDLHAIVDQISHDNPAAASRVTEQIYSSVNNLAHFPAIGRAGRIAGTRELVVANTPYIVPYRVRGERIEILSVFHGSRRWPEEF